MNATRPAKQLRLADAVTEGKETELIKSLQADLRLAYRERDDWMNKCKALHTTKIIEAVIEFASKALGVALSNYREVELTEMTATACLLGVLLGRYATLSVRPSRSCRSMGIGCRNCSPRQHRKTRGVSIDRRITVARGHAARQDARGPSDRRIPHRAGEAGVRRGVREGEQALRWADPTRYVRVANDTLRNLL